MATYQKILKRHNIQNKLDKSFEKTKWESIFKILIDKVFSVEKKSGVYFILSNLDLNLHYYKRHVVADRTHASQLRLQMQTIRNV